MENHPVKTVLHLELIIITFQRENLFFWLKYIATVLGSLSLDLDFCFFG